MSSSRRLVILGATGQLGSDLAKAAQAQGLDTVALGHGEVEVTDPGSVARALKGARIVINSAAFHQVDRCEDDPHEAYRVNAVGALVVARAAREVGARCVYVSTDYVFDGEKSPSENVSLTPRNSYVEDDAVRPLNIYGSSKAAGEQLVAQVAENALVVRVSSLFGVAGARGKGGNFIEAILKKAREGGPLKVVNDQWMTPTYTADAATAIVRLALSDATGTVHVTNSGGCTWHAFAAEAVKLTGLAVPVEPVPASSYPSKARRPRNSALSTSRLASLLGGPLRSWREALQAYLREKGHVS
jgi:dTDP-4-dehydrorhamnose reductase